MITRWLWSLPDRYNKQGLSLDGRRFTQKISHFSYPRSSAVKKMAATIGSLRN